MSSPSKIAVSLADSDADTDTECNTWEFAKHQVDTQPFDGFYLAEVFGAGVTDVVAWDAAGFDVSVLRNLDGDGSNWSATLVAEDVGQGSFPIGDLDGDLDMAPASTGTNRSAFHDQSAQLILFF